MLPARAVDRNPGAPECEFCPAGQYSYPESPGCTTCDLGELFNGAYCESCPECPANTFSGEGTGCDPCEPGFVSEPGSSQCSCPGGQFIGSNGCTPCGEGEVSTSPPSDTCTPCTDGQQPNSGQTECVSGPSAIPRKKRAEWHCGPGFLACAVPNTPGTFECVNVLSDLESCGGCIGRGGVDCTAFDPLASSTCEAGVCLHECPEGYTLTEYGCEE
ncbi:hypothetical protein IAU60_005431 [Kwoniella sp. DSM 27419]